MGLEEHELREWVQRVTRGEASRRQFMRTMLGLGLAGPVVADMLGAYAPAAAQDRRDVQPTFSPNHAGERREIAPAMVRRPDDSEPPPR